MKENNKNTTKYSNKNCGILLLLFNYCKYLKTKSAIPLANSGGTAFPTC